MFIFYLLTSQTFGHILCYIPFHPSSPIVLFHILVHLVTYRMHAEYGIVAFIHQLIFQFLSIQYVSHPDSRFDSNGGSEPGSRRETIYWDSLLVFFFHTYSPESHLHIQKTVLLHLQIKARDIL